MEEDLYQTVQYSFRLPLFLRRAAKSRAALEGTTLNKLIMQWLESYVAEPVKMTNLELVRFRAEHGRDPEGLPPLERHPGQ